MVDFLWDRGRPRPLVAQKASRRKLFVLRTGAGEGARGPIKSGYQCPNLEFQTNPLPLFTDACRCATQARLVNPQFEIRSPKFDGDSIRVRSEGLGCGLVGRLRS